MALTALKGKPIKRKKAAKARRKTTGAGAAPLDNYKVAKDFFHFDVDRKEYIPVIKQYIKKNFNKATATEILKNPDKYFTQEVLEQLDEIAKEQFSYGSSI